MKELGIGEVVDRDSQITQQMQKHSTFFHEADGDGDQQLSFSEFVDALPSHLRQTRPLAELKDWFRLVDADGSGTISLQEWFAWSLSATSATTGAGVVNIFQAYDADRSGRLDKVEFRRACESVGFGEHANTLFAELPLNKDGSVNYLKTVDQLTSGLSSSSTMKSFLATMAWKPTADPAGGTAMWSLAADDPETLRAELCKLLTWHGVSMTELFETVDASGDRSVSADEFVGGLMRVLQFEGEPHVLRDAFAALDADGSGELTFDELDAWVRGRGAVGKDASIRAVRALTLPVGADDEPWEVPQLRAALHELLNSAGLAVADLLAAWDDDDDGMLPRRSYLSHFKRLVGDENVWYAKVRGAASDFYDRFDANHDHSIRVVDIERGFMKRHATPPEGSRDARRGEGGKRGSYGAARRLRRIGNATFGAATIDPGEIWIPPLRSSQKLMSPAVLDTLAAYAGEEDRTHLGRLAQPRSTSPTRRHVRILRPHHLPPLRAPPSPSESLLAPILSHTVAVAEGTQSAERASTARLQLSRSERTLPFYTAASRSAGALEAMVGAANLSKCARGRHGRALMLEGGAPLQLLHSTSVPLLPVARSRSETY